MNQLKFWKLVSRHKACIIEFDDMLISNQKTLDLFFTKRGRGNSDFWYLAQSSFDLPKRTIRKNSQSVVFQAISVNKNGTSKTPVTFSENTNLRKTHFEKKISQETFQSCLYWNLPNPLQKFLIF